MLRFIPWWVRGLAVLALVAGIWGHGFVKGGDRAKSKFAEEARETQAELNEARDKAATQEAARLTAERQRDALARRLTGAAFADPDADKPALSAAAVARINQQ